MYFCVHVLVGAGKWAELLNWLFESWIYFLNTATRRKRYTEALYTSKRVHFEMGPGRVAQSVGHLTRKSGVLGSIPGLATYFRFSFRFFKKGSCQLLAKVCAQSTG